ncbi:hypothetical protein L5515_002187 [Caenorhabditis briggsae]|nr:hypothetical protein L5515_002187 [Caenorhabditis briggsae]
MPATKALLKVDDKRSRKQTMGRSVFVVLFAFLLPVSNADQTLQEFKEPYESIMDVSSIHTCYILGGEGFEQVDPGNVEKGYKCTITLRSPTVDNKHAKERCESRIPFYIIDSKPASCTFQVNLRCSIGYWQIKGKCYKPLAEKLTWKDAESKCNVTHLTNPRVAEFSHAGLGNYFADMLDIIDAWVTVPELEDYFEN